MPNHFIAPSLLSADFAHLDDEAEMLNASEADWFHLDIMDGVFVPNISFGFPVVKAIKKQTNKPLDVHLMIVHPEKYITKFRDSGADWLTVHYEACTHLHRTIQEIKQAGMHAGVALNPHTPASLLHDILPELDMILIMSVNPGFGGQTFIQNSLRKVEELRNTIDRLGLKTLIEVDGGVNRSTGKQLIDAGADVLVAGNFVFKSDDPEKTIQDLKNL